MTFKPILESRSIFSYKYNFRDHGGKQFVLVLVLVSIKLNVYRSWIKQMDMFNWHCY